MDNPVAIYWSGVSVYWHSVIIALAAAATLICASVLYKARGGSFVDIGLAALLGFIPSMELGRIYYCYFAQEGFSSSQEMYQLGKGGYALYGVMAGYMLTIWLYSILVKKKTAAMFDAIAPAAALGIAIGRFASYFSGDDFGRAVTDPEKQHFPIAVYSYSRNEWNLAVFSFEAIAALVVFIALLALFNQKGSKDFLYRDGDTALMFLLLYGIPQTVFESMRNDSLFLISLGFVRISQVISILLATLAFIIFCVRSGKKGLTNLHYIVWVLCLGCIALAFWMEFCITNETAVRNYTIMSLCLLFYMFIGLALYFDGSSRDMMKPSAPAHPQQRTPVRR